MKILKDIEFNGKWLGSRFEVVKLPTEFVYPNRWMNEVNPFVLQTYIAYGYTLPRKDFPCKVIKTDRSESWHDQVAIEIHEDYGSDGHIEYKFQGKFVIVYNDQIPKSFEEYVALTNKVHRYEVYLREHNEQLSLKFRYW